MGLGFGRAEARARRGILAPPESLANRPVRWPVECSFLGRHLTAYIPSGISWQELAGVFNLSQEPFTLRLVHHTSSWSLG